MVLELIVVGVVSSLVAVIVTYFVTKKLNSANYKIHIEQAKAKAKAIEHEAEIFLQESKIKAKELEIESKKRFDEETSRIKREYENRINSLDKKEEKLTRRLEKEINDVQDEKQELKKRKQKSESLALDLEKIKESYSKKLDESIKLTAQIAGLTKDEAKEIALKKAEEECRGEIAHIVRKYENLAKEDAKRRANYIIAQATTRFAGEFAAERLINVVNLPDDELKGRIIGKEGRNIKTLEMLSGVDIIIDDTPGAIILSSFNLYRRAIATKTIEQLVLDGRIQPSKIEEMYEKTTLEFEEKILEEGRNILLDLGLNGVHAEITRLVGRLKYRASYGQNALGHSLEVAHLAGIIAAELGGDELLAKRAGILHDIGKALTQEYSGNHVDLGAEICKRYKEHDVVINAIYAHHGHQDALSIESAAVCTADTLSAARPGARREVLESFLKRVQDIEQIASSRDGVKQAFAINAGREIRVIVNASLINDDESALLAKEIALEIEKKIQFPGEIKVSVIREIRAIEYAK